MFYILIDRRTNVFYMKPNELMFHAYTSLDNIPTLSKHMKMVETEYDSEQELMTSMFNAGFLKGYIDSQEKIITKNQITYYNKNSNEIAYAQYLLTQNTDYLEVMIDTHRLVTICQIKDNQILFPMVMLENDEPAVLAYTDLLRIPQSLFLKYPNYHVVNMTCNIKCVVNNKFIAEK